MLQMGKDMECYWGKADAEEVLEKIENVNSNCNRGILPTVLRNLVK